MSSGTEGLVEAFPSPDERWQQTVNGVSPWEESFDRVPFEEIGGTKRVRYYQELAANRALSPEKVNP